jgi:hypothetical protein
MPTFTLISSVTVGSGGASSIDFTSIPSTYTDLCIKLSARVTGTGTIANIGLKFNNITTSFSGLYLGGNGSSAVSGSPVTELTIWTATYNDSTVNTFGNSEIYIPNYTSANNKSVSTDGVGENNATDGRQAFTATLWSNISAINRITLTPQVGPGDFMQHSTAYLYGVSNA